MSAHAPAPSDAAADAAWDEIMSIARRHALVVAGAGGAVTLATVAVQREAPGLRARVLMMHCMDEHEGAPPSVPAEDPEAEL